MRLIARPFAPGRSSIVRALVGLVVAPTAAFILIPLPLAFFALSGDWGGEKSNTDPLAGLPLIGIGYAVTLAITVIGGGLVWIGLRASRRESGKAYTIAGAVLGLVIAMRMGFTTISTLLNPSAPLVIALCVLVGALVALSFWLIAREPGTVAPPASQTAS